MLRISQKQFVRGMVVLDRMDGARLSQRVRRAAEAFRRAHEDYLRGLEEIHDAQADLDRAGRGVYEADAALDEAILVLADKIVGAQLGSRRKPFASFSRHSPTKITKLAYATELNAVRSLCAKVSRVAPPGEVRVAIRVCLDQADTVEAALRKLSLPRTRFRQRLSALDERIKAWRDGYRRLKTEAAAYWIDDVTTLRAIFARPEPIQHPVRRKRNRQAVPSQRLQASRA